MGGAGGEAVGTAGGGEEGGAVVYGCDFACCVWVMSRCLSSYFFSCCSRCFFFFTQARRNGKGGRLNMECWVSSCTYTVMALTDEVTEFGGARVVHDHGPEGGKGTWVIEG